jgi:hypothetical protein
MKFHYGALYTTPGAAEALKEAGVSPLAYVARHIAGEWGDLCEEDKRRNDEALEDGSRILSAYILPKTGVKIWVITEADRSATTVLLPSEY